MKILMVAMPSLHFFRWTEQLKDAGHEVFWFDIVDGGEKVARISWVHQIVGWKFKWNFPGRYFLKMKFPKLHDFIASFNTRDTGTVFEKKLLEIQPDVVHSFALQIACLPILSVMLKHKQIKWVYSSWGSDIYYSKQMRINENRIEEALQRIDFLITDCLRDFKIAEVKGFKNIFLGVLPGNGGIQYDESAILPLSKRKIILIKGYNDSIGKGIISVKAISSDLIPLLKDFTIFVFGADKEITEYIKDRDVFKKLKTKIYLKSEFIDNTELLKIMGASYIYIGNSLSDGLPNSLIEAAGMGAFPIQSNHGNVTIELIKNEQNGLLINDSLNNKEIESLMKKALLNFDMVEKAFEYNTNIIKEKYSREKTKVEIIKLL